MSKPVDDLQSALMMTGLVQPVSSNQKGGWLEVLCRLVPGQEKAWLSVVEAMLKEMNAGGIRDPFILARRYILKDDRMVFGWYLSIGMKNSKELATIVSGLLAVLSRTRPGLEAAPVQPKPSPPPAPTPHLRSRIPETVRTQTNAVPRSPSDGTDPNPPNGTPVRRAVVHQTGDGKHEVVEMPLPHVYGELNVPKPGSLKGARKMGGS